MIDVENIYDEKKDNANQKLCLVSFNCNDYLPRPHHFNFVKNVLFGYSMLNPLDLIKMLITRNSQEKLEILWNQTYELIKNKIDCEKIDFNGTSIDVYELCDKESVAIITPPKPLRFQESLYVGIYYNYAENIDNLIRFFTYDLSYGHTFPFCEWLPGRFVEFGFAKNSSVENFIEDIRRVTSKTTSIAV